MTARAAGVRALLAALLAGAVWGPARAGEAKAAPAPAPSPAAAAPEAAPAAVPDAAAAAAVEDGLAELIGKKLLPTYVFVGGASGVVISPDGLVLTNHHVAGSAKAWKVRTASGRAYVADVLGTDPVGDVLLLKMRGAAGLPAAELADSDALEVGQTVVAVGNPFGLGFSDESPTVTVGVISATHRYAGSYSDAVQTDAPLNPGNSGGPLFTLDGRLAGINGRISTRFGTTSNTGIGYAIPANQVRRFLPALKAAGGGTVEHGTIAGLRLKPFVPEAGQGEDRAVVGAVAAGSTAEQCGFRPGDEVLALDGQAIGHHARFAGVLGTYPAGAEVEVAVRRGGAEERLKVKLDVLHVPVPVDFGWLLARPTPESLRARGGLQVLRVAKDGPADKAGIKGGDVITEIEGLKLADPEAVAGLGEQGFEPGKAVKGRLRRTSRDAAGVESSEEIEFQVTPRKAPRLPVPRTFRR